MIKKGMIFYRVDSEGKVETWVVRSIMNRPRTRWDLKLADPVKMIYMVNKCEDTYGIISNKKVTINGHKRMERGWRSSIHEVYRFSIELDRAGELGKHHGYSRARKGAYFWAIKRKKSEIKRHEGYRDESDDPDYYDYIKDMKRELKRMEKTYSKIKNSDRGEGEK